MREYDEVTLKRVQKAELGILKDFMALCDSHGLTYFGIAGTAIGAIRHQGFIPWDDDIDVAMPRRDFEKFVRLAEAKMSDKYEIINFEHNENYPLMTTRWMLRGSKFREHALKDIDCPLGIFLDIYPLDNIPDDEKEFRRQCAQSFFWSKLLILRSVPRPVLGFTGFKAKLVTAICGAVHWGMKALHISKRKLYEKCYRASTQYNRRTDTERIDFLCDTTPYMNIYYRKDIFPLKKLPFEDVMLNFPKNVDVNLTSVYGDYMQLPPEDKRKNHFPYELEFPREEEPS